MFVIHKDTLILLFFPIRKTYMKTKKEIVIGYAGTTLPYVTFPVGTSTRLAKNLGLDRNGEKQYWLSLPRGHKYGKFVTSYARVYGYHASYSEIF